MSRTTRKWINLGVFGINILNIKGGKSPFVELKDTDASKSGRPPKVIGSVPNLKACRSEKELMTVVWTLRNVAHHDHVRTFATKFEDKKEAELFLLIFNGLASEVEERCNKTRAEIITSVKKSLFSPVVDVKRTATTSRADKEEQVDADRDDEEQDNDDEDSFGDEWDFSVNDEEVDADRDADEEDKKEDGEDSFEDDFANTQQWPEDHDILHPFAAH